jgi:hypothetical protein
MLNRKNYTTPAVARAAAESVISFRYDSAKQKTSLASRFTRFPDSASPGCWRRAYLRGLPCRATPNGPLKSFTRIIKEIMIAARSGGDPDGNPRLRTAILAAKAVSMPADNIKKAIMRGTCELKGGQIEEVIFEGYGPEGAAVLVNVATDNRNPRVR